MANFMLCTYGEQPLSNLTFYTQKLLLKVTDYTQIHLYTIFCKAHVSLSIKTKTHNHFVYVWVYMMKLIADTPRRKVSIK